MSRNVTNVVQEQYMAAKSLLRSSLTVTRRSGVREKLRKMVHIEIQWREKREARANT